LSRHLTDQYLSYFKLFLNFILKSGLFFSYHFCFLVIEKGLVEWSGPYLLSNCLANVSGFLFKKTPHFTTLYIGFIFVFSILLFLFFLV